MRTRRSMKAWLPVRRSVSASVLESAAGPLHAAHGSSSRSALTVRVISDSRGNCSYGVKTRRAAVAKLWMTVAYARLPVDPSEAWLEALRLTARAAATPSPTCTTCCCGRPLRDRTAPAALSFVARESSTTWLSQRQNDALVAVLAKLDDYRGASRFPPGPTSSALLEAVVRLRRRRAGARWCSSPIAGRTSQTMRPPNGLPRASTSCASSSARSGGPHAAPARRVRGTPLNEVPIDVLAERLDTTRGALYKTLHDARTKLRRELAASGYLQEDS